jgi:MFS family permease
MDIHQRFHTSLAAYPARKAVLFITAVVVALHLALSLFAWALAQHEIVPVLEQKAYATGLAEARRLTRRLADGTPLEQLDGIQQQFDQALQRNPDLAYIILTDSAGRILVRSGSGGEVFTPERYSAVTREVERRLVTYGLVHVGIDRQFIVARMKGVRTDVAMVLAASLLLALGTAWYAAGQAFARPVGQVAQVLARLAAGDYRFRTRAAAQAVEGAVDGLLERVNRAYRELAQLAAAPSGSARGKAAFERLRTQRQFADGDPAVPAGALDRATPVLLAFLCWLADALTRPALAHYGAELAAFRSSVPAPLRAGLPVAALYLAAALAIPLAAGWRQHAGRRATFLAGCLLLFLGSAAAALVDDYVTLVVARCTSGIGMALALAASLDNAAPGDRRSGAGVLAAFAVAAGAAEIIGPLVGGIVARHGSVRDMFALAAALAAVAATAGWAMLDRGAPLAPPSTRKSLGAPAGRPAHWRRMLLLSLAAQLPAAAAAAAMLALLLPLALRQAGYDYAVAGRVGLLAAAPVVAIAPLFLRLAYRSKRYALAGVVGAALVGSGIGPLSQWLPGYSAAQSAWAPLLLLLAGQVLLFGTALVLAQRATRAAEFRLGALPSWPWTAPLVCASAACGALLAGAAAQAQGAAGAAAAAGSMSLVAGAGFTLAYLASVTIRPT